MNLYNWFQEKQKYQPSLLQKMQVYQRFLDKSNKSFKVHTFRHYIKVGIFSFILLSVVGLNYFSLKSDNIYFTVHKEKSYSIIKPQHGVVLAKRLGKIIKTTGEIHIINTKNNKTINTSDLHANERVILTDHAEIEFIVRENIRAKIIGPASFELQDLGTKNNINNYAINLISGDYFEIINRKKEEKKDIIHQENKTRKQQENKKRDIHEGKKEHIIIKSKTFTVESKKITGDINIIISTSKQGRKELKNEGEEIIMKTITEKKEKYIVIAPKQKITVNNHIKPINIKKLKNDIKEKQLSIHYEVKMNQETHTKKLKNTTISDVLQKTLTSHKKVISEKALIDFDKALFSALLNNSINQMKQYSIEKNESAFNIAYGNLLERIYKGYAALKIPVNRISANKNTISLGITLVHKLLMSAKNIYYIDPSHLTPLYSTENALRTLVNISQTKPIIKKNIDSVSTKTKPTKIKSNIIKNKAIKAKSLKPLSNKEISIEEELREFGIK